MHKAILFLERGYAAYVAKDCCQLVMLITYVFEHSSYEARLIACKC